MPGRVTSASFIGRVDELERLLEALLATDGSGPRVVLVAGDAGVGKTRLVTQFADRAREMGARVLLGACLNLDNAALPYAPIVQALRPIAREIDAGDEQELVDDAAPVLSRLFPDLSATQIRDEDRRETSQSQLFEGLLRLLESLAARSPIVLLVEDLHWADDSTRDLVSFLARNPPRGPAALVATYRADELHRQHPLRPFLAEMARSGGVERIMLSPFDRSELSALLSEILGAAPAPEFVDQVLDRSEGNAFFAEQLVAASADGPAGGLPATLREILLAKIETLPDDAATVLRVAAAAGRQVHHELLAAATDFDSGRLLDALRSAIEQQVLVAGVNEPSYAFRHALLAEAVGWTLLPGERSLLHATLAQTLSARPELASGEPSGEIAHHWYAAYDLPRALEASIRAAQAAEALYGYAEASRHLSRALELWAQVPDAEELAGMDLSGVQLSAAEMTYLAGGYAEAAALARRGIAERGSGADPVRLALMHERLARYLWAAGDGDGSLEAYERAVELMPAGASAERATVLSSHGQVLMLIQRIIESRRRCEEAIEIARDVGARAAEGHALNTLGVDVCLLGETDTGIGMLDEALRIAEEVKDVDDIARAYVNCSEMLRGAGRSREAAAVGLRGMEVARANGCELAYGPFIASNATAALFDAGEWDQADTVLASVRFARGSLRQIWVNLTPIELATARGDFATAGDLLRTVRGAGGATDPQSEHWLAVCEATLAIWEGRLDDARSAVATSLQRLARYDVGLETRALCALGLRAEGDRAEQAAARRDSEELASARKAAASLADYERGRASKEEQLSATPLPVAVAWGIEAAAERSRIESRSDPSLWAESAGSWDELDHPYRAAYARWRQAEALLASDGAREDAAALLRTAQATTGRLGARPLDDAVRALARRARINLEPASSDQVDEPEGQDSPRSLFGLTDRELDVLRLLADGRTNREIGQALFISAKTASVHVSNILRKLEVSGRVEAAVAAQRLGLGSTDE